MARLTHRRFFLFGALASMAFGLAACRRGPGTSDSSDLCEDADCGGSSGDSGNTADAGTIGPFELRAEFDGPCEKVKGVIDVNLGNSAEATVRALWCQITGEEPDAARVSDWAERLRTVDYVRRIDVARTFCQEAGRSCNSFNYTDPWLAHEDLTDGCTRKTDRDMGAVFMFFNDCPANTNCEMNWSNNHALGSLTPHKLYQWGDESDPEYGYYNPRNSGFWRRELLDARWAGLQFIMPNVYGPDLAASTDTLPHLAAALADVPDIQVALFDDTWIWGKGGNLAGIWGPSVGEPWTTVPNFDDTQAAAQTLYDNKWKPFFTAVPRERWYLRDGRPFVFFYNAGTFGNKAPQSAAVLEAIKQLFEADFGVEPFVVVDTAFFVQGQNAAASGRFTWNSGACPSPDLFHCGSTSSFTMDGTRIDHQMVRWDDTNRDLLGSIATESNRIVKGPEDLTTYLGTSADADVAVIATWNDLGEGTGIHRNYDYYYKGAWQKPNAFLSLIRESQCSN